MSKGSSTGSCRNTNPWEDCDDYQGDILISSCSLLLKSLVTWPGAIDGDLDEYLMNKDKRFDQLEHVAYIDFDRFGLHPHLKYVHGHSDHGRQGI